MVKKLQITYKIQFAQCITDQIESNLRITLEAKTLERFEARLMHYDRAWPTWNLIKAFISSKLPLVDYACGIIFKCHFRIIKIHFIADLILFRFFHEIVGFQNGLIDMLWMLIKLSIASLESFQSIDLFLWHVLHPTTVSVRKLSWLFTSLSAILLLLFLLILFDASLPARRIVNGVEWFFCSCQFCFSFSVLESSETTSLELVVLDEFVRANVVNWFFLCDVFADLIERLFYSLIDLFKFKNKIANKILTDMRWRTTSLSTWVSFLREALDRSCK